MMLAKMETKFDWVVQINMRKTWNDNTMDFITLFIRLFDLIDFNLIFQGKKFLIVVNTYTKEKIASYNGHLYWTAIFSKLIIFNIRNNSKSCWDLLWCIVRITRILMRSTLLWVRKRKSFLIWISGPLAFITFTIWRTWVMPSMPSVFFINAAT